MTRLEVISRPLCAFLAAALVSVAHAQEFSPFQRFAIERAHEQAFKQCDRAIARAFANASGHDLRVTTHVFNETKSDSISLTAVYGKLNDTVQVQLQVRRLGGRCYATETGTTIHARSCAAYLGEYKSWHIEAETLGVIFAKNPGGVGLVLTPTGSGCVATIHHAYID